jgi:hypothetical protein
LYFLLKHGCEFFIGLQLLHQIETTDQIIVNVQLRIRRPAEKSKLNILKSEKRNDFRNKPVAVFFETLSGGLIRQNVKSVELDVLGLQNLHHLSRETTTRRGRITLM